MADDCGLISLDPWCFRPDSSLFSLAESFTRDNDALTRALQFSLSGSTTSSSPDTRPVSTRPDPIARNPLPCSPSAKISKRKSRASKKSPTTYITADPANFRQMVQQVTGVRFGEPGQMPVDSLIRPEPVRSGSGFGQGLVSCLPTLDTSAGLLDRARMVGPVGEGAGFEGFGASFPTLESWGGAV